MLRLSSLKTAIVGKFISLSSNGDNFDCQMLSLLETCTCIFKTKKKDKKKENNEKKQTRFA